MKVREILLLVSVCWCYATQAQAVILDYNHAFSYSEIGTETISYGETTTVAGYQLNLSQAVTNAVQRSGGYTPLSDELGFYIQSATTLDPLPAEESWNISPFGSVQTNQRKVRWNELSVLLSWQFHETGYHAVTGMNISALSFTRSYFQRSTGTAAFEAATASTLSLPTGSITEDSTNVSALIGFRYDSTFIDPDETTRLLGGIMLGTPVYYKVENSGFPGVRWVEYFQGYDVVANIGYGMQIHEKFLFSMHTEVIYKKRFETSGLAVAGGTGRIPEVTIWNARVTAGVEWSY